MAGSSHAAAARRRGVGEVIVDDDPRLADRLQPALAIALETALEQPADRAGVEAGSRFQSMSARSTSAIVCDVVSPSKRRRPASISNSTTPNAQMSDALVDQRAAGLLGAHVGDRAHHDARARSRPR